MSDDAFTRFLERRARDFIRIAGATRGEWKAEDVRQHAWLLMFDLGQHRDRPFDLDDPADEDFLIRCLHNHCAKYAERTLRHAHRLDQAAPGGDDASHHWLRDLLVSDEGQHPASLLEAAQCAVAEPGYPHAYHSPAAAWLDLVTRLGNRIANVADFLLISPSWCARCFRRALRQAQTQSPLPELRVDADPGASLQPWRSFRLPTRGPVHIDPSQPPLDFWSRPLDPPTGQRWLL